MIGAGPRRPRRRAGGRSPVLCPVGLPPAVGDIDGDRRMVAAWCGCLAGPDRVDLPAQSHDCRAAFRGMARAAILGDLLVLDRRSDPAFSLSPVPGNCGGGAVGLGQDWRAGRDGAGVLCPGARPSMLTGVLGAPPLADPAILPALD